VERWAHGEHSAGLVDDVLGVFVATRTTITRPPRLELAGALLHDHQAVETPDAGPSKGIRSLGVGHKKSTSLGRVGHLFQGRFKAILSERERELRELARDGVLNPVRAGLVDAPRDWPWSSDRATVGEEGSVRAL
jgi:hypothetical protein